MFTTQFWLIVIGFAQMIGCSWIFSMFLKLEFLLRATLRRMETMKLQNTIFFVTLRHI